MDIEPLAMKKGYWVEGHYYEDLQDGEWCSWIQECNDIIHYFVYFVNKIYIFFAH